MADEKKQTPPGSGGDRPRADRASLRRSLAPGTSAQTTIRLTRPGDGDDPESFQPPGADEFPANFAPGPLLGAGGMAAVFECRQLSLDRPVALKALGHPKDEVKREAFQREAFLTGSLGHPTIPPVHDLVRNADGIPFLVMKKIEGRPWSEVLHEKSLDENLEILLRVADGVAFAHAHDVIHRDIKPQNVSLGRYGEVYLMDWGLAVQRDAEGFFLREIGGAATAGTPAYMAPEMALGIGPDIDERCDLYLLGATLYEIVAGFPPHPGALATESLVAAAENEIRDPGLRHECLDIAMRALATEPHERTPGVQEFQAAIRLYRQHAESLALNDSGEAHLRQALESGRYADFDEAQSSFRQALRLWEGNAAAARNLRQARLANARTAFAGGDLELAASQLEAVDDEQRELLDRIDAARRRLEKRRRQFTLLLRGVFALVAGIAVVLLVSTLWIREEQRRTATALEELQSEQEQRRADRRQAAPALVVTARRLITENDFDAARAAAQAALEFDPTLPAAHYLEIGLRLHARRFAAAAQAAQQLLDRAPGEADAQTLLRVARIAARDREQTEPRVLAELTPVLVRQGLPTVAVEFAFSREERLAFWLARLREAWPGVEWSADALGWQGNERLFLRIPPDIQIEKLDPLAGMPLADLDLAGQQAIADLSPLRGMPLRRLNLSGCVGISDLSGLRGLPLESLDLSGAYRVEDLEPLRDLPLRSLTIRDLRRLTSIEPLRSPPLESLIMSGAENVSDLEPLRGKRITTLSLSSCRGLSRIDALSDMPLETLYLRKVELESYQALRGLPLEILQLDGSNFADLAILSQSPLESLTLIGTPVRDLRPLRNFPLQTLRIDRLPDSSVLAGMRRLQVLKVTQYAGDLRGLAELPLRELDLPGVEDVAPLRGLPLESLRLGAYDVTDPPRNLDALRSPPLRRLTITGAALARDLSWIDGMDLEELTIQLQSWFENPVLDFRQLSQARIRTLILPRFADLAGLAALRQIESLRQIGFPGEPMMTPAEFQQWAQIESDEN